MVYHVEQRIHTLADNIVGYTNAGSSQFIVEGVNFSPWMVKPSDGYWTHPYWLAFADIEATDWKAAWRQFSKVLAKVVSRIAVINQCYAEYAGEPFLILREGSGVALIRWVGERGAVGLGFDDDERKALDLLLKNHEIPEAFYYYWKDATNSSGYASKLLLMFSAVEALVTTRIKGQRSKKDFTKLEMILGSELKTDLWGSEKDSVSALRHRLIHGEYFQPGDGQKDYLNLLHGRIVKYLNQSALNEELLRENVVNPQRHPFGSKYQGYSVIQALNNAKLRLIDVITDTEQTGYTEFTNYERVPGEQYWDSY